MKINPKVFLIGLVIFLVSCGVLSALVNGLGHTSRDNLDSLALVKSMEVMNQQAQTLDHSLSLMDKLVTTLTVQNLLMVAALFIFAMVIVYAITKLIKAIATHNAGGGQVQVIGGPVQPGYQQLPGMPHYASFGQSGLNYLLSLPPAQREYALKELMLLAGALNQSLGKHSEVKLLNSKTGKEVKW